MLVLYAGVGHVLTYPGVAIRKIEVVGAAALSPDALAANVQKSLATVRGGCYYAGTIATYDRGAIESALLADYPHLATAQVKADGLTTLRVHVSERVPAALWCESVEQDTEGGGRCFMIDAQGFVFEHVPLSSPEAASSSPLVHYTGNLAGAPLRQTLLRGHFPEVHTFVSALGKLGITPTTVHLLGDEATIESAAHPLLKVKLDNQLDRTLAYLGTVLDSSEYKDATESEEGVGYIDLRFDNRVYYK